MTATRPAAAAPAVHVALHTARRLVDCACGETFTGRGAGRAHRFHVASRVAER